MEDVVMDALPIQYLAELRAKGFRSALRINGIDLAEFADHSADVFSARLNVWLRRGRNVLTATFQPLPGGSENRASRLQILAVDSARRPTEIFASGETAGAAIRFEIAVEQSTGSVLERLDGAAGTTADNEEILAVVAELQGALVARNVERIVALQRIQLEEKSIAVNVPVDRTLAGYEQFLNELWAAPDLAVRPLAAIVRPTVLPGLVQVVDRSGAPAIMARNGELRFSINPYLAKVGGQWEIVR